MQAQEMVEDQVMPCYSECLNISSFSLSNRYAALALVTRILFVPEMRVLCWLATKLLLKVYPATIDFLLRIQHRRSFVSDHVSTKIVKRR